MSHDIVDSLGLSEALVIAARIQASTRLCDTTAHLLLDWSWPLSGNTQITSASLSGRNKAK